MCQSIEENSIWEPFGFYAKTMPTLETLPEVMDSNWVWIENWNKYRLVWKSSKIEWQVQYLAILVMALTQVSRVISFRRRSKSKGKLCWSSVSIWSPNVYIICPIQVMALSLTSWSMSAAFSLIIVDSYIGLINGIKLKFDEMFVSINK